LKIKSTQKVDYHYS